jgi:hypothetical protein
MRSWKHFDDQLVFRDTMLKLIHSDNLEYKELTAA